ncbi:DUF3823 domain-containing protein [Pedobacter ginsengisoli]|uniref:DUF3823 domain-containing protein n=1 Tax=Pedobacter ginsengisoli TaxID=363852 RepID=UPI00254A86A1|nr:DUF3823 domain-containing protein [Pedobacter ginsengisoli]
MNKNRILVLYSILALSALSACKLDNFEKPAAGLSGRFIDAETKELVQQDIIRGTQIEIKEHGYDPVSSQFLLVKNDGTYENSMLFANTYTIQPVRGNFIAVDPQDFKISGQAKLDFEVIPYIRIKEANIVKTGTKIIATFKLQQNLINNIKKIGLYAHVDSRVGEPMRQVAAERELNAVSDPAEVYTLEIDLPSNNSILKPGNQYYFRIGALMDAPEAKLNYAAAVRIGI